jgi:hypothetical protein
MSTKNMAVVCRLAELPGGSLRVVLDDVGEGEAPGTWTYHSLFTYKDYVPGGLDDLTALTDTELADFGYHVLARLFASNGRNG